MKGMGFCVKKDCPIAFSPLRNSDKILFEIFIGITQQWKMWWYVRNLFVNFLKENSNWMIRSWSEWNKHLHFCLYFENYALCAQLFGTAPQLISWIVLFSGCTSNLKNYHFRWYNPGSLFRPCIYDKYYTNFCETFGSNLFLNLSL